MNLDTDFKSFAKTNSKWITDINMKHKTIKLPEDNTGKDPGNLGFGNDFRDNNKGIINKRNN